MAAGLTVMGDFLAVSDARSCVIELRAAGFDEDRVGFYAGPRWATVTVLPGARIAEAELILRRRGARPPRRRFTSALRQAVRRFFQLR